MFFTEEKIEARINELESFRYRDPQAIREFRFLLDTEGEIGSYPPQAGEWTIKRVGDSWKGCDLYAWLAASVRIPAEWKGRKVLGRFDFGKTSGGTNNGFESLLFVNGEPYQGVDQNHQEVFFSEESIGCELQLHFRLWSGLGGYKGYSTTQDHRLKLAEIVWLDEAVDDLYFTSTVVLETVKVLDANSPERAMLLTALNKAMNLIDWRQPGSDAFYDSVFQANERMNKELEQLEKHHPVTVWCIGHTHIDVAWLWRLRHTREKCARSFSTVLRLMEQYPEYVFLQSQPQLYEYIKKDYPAIYEQIKKKVSEGRWEPEGGMWLEADCNLTSGESLVRQLLIGTRFFLKEFGTACEYLWLPDVFGYSWALPQILNKSGIKLFLTSKLSRNQYNRMPHDTFMWRGIDGSEVLTHFLTTPAPGPKAADSWFTYNGRITPKSVQDTWKSYRNKDLNQELLLSYGYGDGGGGVNRDMLEMRRRIDHMPGLPHVKTGKAGDYFQQLRERVANAESYVHTWDGELYLECHRGTYTSQAHIKRMNRKLELLYREVEWLSVLNCLVKTGWEAYPQEPLNEGWKIILRNQFHDIIPGSSIREVYEDCWMEYVEAENIGMKVRDTSFRSLTSHTDAAAFTIFNSAAWNRSELIPITMEPGMDSGQWYDRHGQPLNAQKSGNQWLVQVRDIPSVGYTTITFEAETSQEWSNESFTLLENGIITPFFELCWNESGQLTRITDLEAGREVLAPGTCGNVFQVFEDKPMRYEAWDIDLFYMEKMTVVDVLESVKVTEIGALRAVVSFEWRYTDSVIKQDMVLYADSRRIDFITHVDWRERQQLLKTAFPVQIRATEATYDIQFGNVKRPTHWNTSWDYARFETVGHQWADLSEMNYGVSLLNDCKYGYDIKDNVLRLSLIKSAISPDREADQGSHTFTYSLFPHSGNWFTGHTVQNAWSLNQPLAFTKGCIAEPHKSLFRVSSDSVMIDAIKKTEDGDRLILRLHDYSGNRLQAELESDFQIISWQECDLLERAIGEPIHSGKVTFQLAPYEIKTLILDMAIKQK